jgi:hypothetical protein
VNDITYESSNSFGSNTSLKPVNTEGVISRQAQEVQAAMVVAKRFPRDENEAYARIIQSCKRKTLAEQAEYEFPRGGQKIIGPSIRLAETLARNWGNLDYGIVELEQRSGESTMMAYAWDLETNTRQTKIFAVRHERKAKGKINSLDDPRDIYELVANNGSRRVRACILGIIPGDIVEAAIDQCRATLKTGNAEPLNDRIRKMIVKFDEKFQVSKEMLEKYIGCDDTAFSENDVLRLGKVFNSLKDGMAKREDVFNIAKPKSESREVPDLGFDKEESLKLDKEVPADGTK